MSRHDVYSILVIDDEKSNIIELTNILDSEYEVLAVRDSSAALETAERKMPDLILLDVIMTGMNGYEVIAALKESEKTRDIPVIFITGLDSVEAEEKGFALGAADYIPKPFHSVIVKMRVKNQIRILERQRQYSIVEHATQLAMFITTDASVEYINPAVLSVTGYMQSEIISGGLGLFISEEMLIKLREEYIPKVMQGESVQLELSITRKDRDKRILMIFIVKTGSNSLGVTANDITEIRKLESQLHVAIKNAEYNRDLAERSSRAKSEFLSRMSHEILTPMNAIMGMSQIAGSVDSSDKIKSCLDIIDKSSRQLVIMLHNILNVSGGSSAFSIVEALFAVDKMLGYIQSRMQPELTKKRQTISFGISQDIPEMLIGDEKRISQVLIHLLTNASKFSPDDSEICLSAFIDDDTGEEIFLRFEVTDKGIGISEEQQSALFDLFEQVDGSNTRIYGGIGIGLPLSMCIANMMGGNISVQSELGKGAKFSFTCVIKKI